MDNNTRDQLLITFEEFYSYLQNKKANQLSVSNSTVPKRVHILELPLDIAPTNPYKLPTNITGLQVEGYFTTGSNTSVDGLVKIAFDEENVSNIQNSKSLFANDSFSFLDGAVAKSFLTWTAQPNVTVRIALFIDVDYRSGSTKTAITGSVTTSTKQPDQVVGLNGVGTYTVPAGKYAIITAWNFRPATGTILATIKNPSNVTIFTLATSTSTTVAFAQAAGGNILLPAGYKLDIAISGSVDCSAYIQEYSL